MLGELGLNYDHKDYLPRAPETRTPEFRALNPNGRVPVIDDDGFVLSESMAINLYLSKKDPTPRCIRRTPETRRLPGSGAYGRSTGSTVRS